MHFNLPDQLALEVASYDKTRKKLAASMAAEDRVTKKRNTCPNGRPSNMIPSKIVNDKNWTQIVETINAAPAAQKVQLITKPVFGEEPQPIAIVYYYKQLWVAAWLPHRKDDGYIYGITIAFKQTVAAGKQCKQKFFVNERILGKAMFDMNGTQDELLPLIKEGRTHWFRKTLLISKDDINEGYYGNYWKSANNCNHYIHSYGNTHIINKRIKQWETELLKGIPTFAGGNDRTMFQRLCDEACNFETIMGEYNCKPRWMNYNDNYVHDVDVIIKSLRACPLHREYMDDFYLAPWFRKMVVEAMRKTRELHDEMSKQSVYHKDKLRKPYAILWQFIDSINQIKQIYQDIDLNLLHSRYDWLCMTELTGYHSQTAHDWLRENLPVQSFLNMLEQHYKHEVETKQYRHTDSATGNKHVNMWLWRDTYDMLTQCIAAERTDNLKPKRWRLQDWHDHLMAETWKIQNPNVALPQKLFPEPIKVAIKSDITMAEPDVLGYMTFFQPIDTHQLAAWGRAVRNCVGGGHSYAEGIKKMKHLIILCMIDNKPRYTVQLTVDNGIMNVEQIADISNARLDECQRGQVEDAFILALQQRESQLS